MCNSVFSFLKYYIHPVRAYTLETAAKKNPIADIFFLAQAVLHPCLVYISEYFFISFSPNVLPVPLFSHCIIDCSVSFCCSPWLPKQRNQEWQPCKGTRMASTTIDCRWNGWSWQSLHNHQHQRPNRKAEGEQSTIVVWISSVCFQWWEKKLCHKRKLKNEKDFVHWLQAELRSISIVNFAFRLCTSFLWRIEEHKEERHKNTSNHPRCDVQFVYSARQRK